MINQHPAFAIPQETGFLPELSAKADDYGDFSTEWGRHAFIRDLQWTQATSKTIAFDCFGVNEEQAADLLQAAAPCDYPTAAAALFQDFADRRGKQRWGDKTPRNILSVGWLSEVYPKSRFLHIIRDARDVAASLCKAGWHATLFRAARFWKDRVEAGRLAGSVLPPDRYLELKYEDLLIAPQASLQGVAEWLGVGYEPAMLQYYRDADTQIPSQHADLFELLDKPIDKSRAYAWKPSMKGRDVAEVERVAGPLLAELGYEVTGAKPSIALRMIRRLADSARGNSALRRRLLSVVE